jgi:hypothetical protein
MTFRVKTGGHQLSLAPVSAPTMFNRPRFQRLHMLDAKDHDGSMSHLGQNRQCSDQAKDF